MHGEPVAHPASRSLSCVAEGAISTLSDLYGEAAMTKATAGEFFRDERLPLMWMQLMPWLVTATIRPFNVSGLSARADRPVFVGFPS